MIQMTGFAQEPDALRVGMIDAAARVVGSHHYILGPEVAAFEAAWANASGTKHSVGVASGLDALEIALRVLDIGPGDEVITTPMTAFASVLAIIRAGATPVLADIDPDTALLSIDSVARCLSSRTRAVMLVHLYGQARDVGRWAAFCDDHGIELLEDCAQSHLAVSDGRPAGTFGRVGAYSFYPTKNLGALGDAGALVTDEPALAARAASLRNYGQRERYEHVEAGLNSRLDEMQAAILSARLPWLAAFTERRRAIAAAYRDRLSHPDIRLLAAPRMPSEHVHHQFVLTTTRRDELAAHLQGQGVASLVHYPVPMHRQPALAGIAHDPEGLSMSDRHAAEVLSIPCHPQLSDDDVSAVIAAVNSLTTS